MFSNEPRCIYQKSPVAEVLCQLRYPEILTIEANAPVEFQEAIRAHYPQYNRTQDTAAPHLIGRPGNFALEKPKVITVHRFASLDDVWKVSLTSTSLTIACNKYECWEKFASQLDAPLAAFIKIYQPACFSRVGLRYVNFISRRDVGLENVPFSDILSPCYLGPLMEEDVPDSTISRCSLDTEMALRGGCRLKLHTGPGLIRRGTQQDPEIKFIFDQDLFMSGNLPINLTTGALQTLHGQAFSIFRGAITPLLHEAMEPSEL